MPSPQLSPAPEGSHLGWQAGEGVKQEAVSAQLVAGPPGLCPATCCGGLCSFSRLREKVPGGRMRARG
ncbi:hypothetical protein [Lysobacter gummosus]|uniref:hypothetical protein n=1 Tax=Lysobacter gummosus TaxID=262324 RepID=UPI00363DADD3